MNQVIYVMQFKGRVAPITDSGNVLSSQTKASSCVIRSVADANGVSGVIETIDGGEAHFESQVTYTGDTTFIESGSINFGGGSNKLFFGTIGQAHVDSSADSDLRHGAVIWKVEGGEGLFEGASGIITSNFVVKGSGRAVREIIDNHFGVIFVK